MPNYCHACGRPGSSDGDFCRFCGEKYAAASAVAVEAVPPRIGGVFQEVLPAEPGYSDALRRMRRAERYDSDGDERRIWLKIAAACALLLAVVYWAASGDHRPGPANGGSRVAGFASAIGDPAVTVGARDARVFQFTVRDVPLLRPFLAGSFEAIGGSNDIDVIVVDADGLENFSNGNSYRFFYDSGRVTVAHPDVGPFAPGTYYLIFSNRFSLFTNKAVVNRLQVVYAPL